MTESPSSEKLTTWAASSDNAFVEFVRSTVGPLLLILVTPPAAIIFWIVCTFEPFNGALLPLFTTAGWQSVLAHWPWPTFSAAAIILGYATIQGALLQWLPGKTFEGPITPGGNRPRYKLNGVAAWFVTHALFFGCACGLHLFNLGIVWDRFGAILATLVLFALVFCLFLYFKGIHWPNSPDRSVAGNFIWDYYWGVELHPTLFGINLKQLINCRFSMMGWSVIVCSFAAKQAELDRAGHLSNSMLISVAITVLYLFKFFWWESGYFTSLDIMHDRFGYYICWGVMAWVPAVYAITAQYLVLRPYDMPWLLAAAVLLLGVAAICVNYDADAQRQRVRATNGNTTVWGRPPVVIRAHYKTADGKEHESLLLASGWWGLARHFHYVPEITLGLAWSLPAGFTHFVPYFYVTFLTILLFDRATRDDKRCRKKYGADWDEYCRRVPSKIIPGIY
ncbi:MAG TPA: 7-dehydrocholesterol reductase [Candidatus Binatia bacterium]|jgi:7-dehydrocholesterol reductase